MYTTIQTLTREQIEAAADRAGIAEYDIYEDYSGRGMYGATCLGLDVPETRTAFAILAALALNEQERRGDMEADDVIELVKAAQIDNLGRDWIVYWPGVTLASDDEAGEGGEH